MDTTQLKESVERFWTEYLLDGRDLSTFAANAEGFPDGFLEAYFRFLDRAKWKPELGYEIAKSVMEDLASLSRFSPSARNFNFRIVSEAMSVNSEFELESCQLTSLQESTQKFWDGFFTQRGDLTLALTEFERCFPQRFSNAFISLLGRLGWTKQMDQGYEMVQEYMLQLVFSCVDTKQIISAEKRSRDKDKLKMAYTSSWELGAIQSSVGRFWELFGVGRSDLRAFAASQANTFPKNFINQFISHVDQAGWYYKPDSDYKLPNDIMSLLALDFAKDPEEAQEPVILKVAEEDQAAKEAREREAAERAERQAMEKNERARVNEWQRKQDQKNKAARVTFNAKQKEIRRKKTEKDDRRRVGADALGI